MFDCRRSSSSRSEKVGGATLDEGLSLGGMVVVLLDVLAEIEAQLRLEDLQIYAIWNRHVELVFRSPQANSTVAGAEIAGAAAPGAEDVAASADMKKP